MKRKIVLAESEIAHATRAQRIFQSLDKAMSLSQKSLRELNIAIKKADLAMFEFNKVVQTDLGKVLRNKINVIKEVNSSA